MPVDGASGDETVACAGRYRPPACLGGGDGYLAFTTLYRNGFAAGSVLPRPTSRPKKENDERAPRYGEEAALRTPCGECQRPGVVKSGGMARIV